MSLTSGLVDNIKVYRVDHGTKVNGVIQPTLVEVAASLPARQTTIEKEDESVIRQHPEGRRGKDKFKYVVANTTVFNDRDKTYIIEDLLDNTQYDVLISKRQRNREGAFHHVSLLVTRIHGVT